MDNLVCKHEVTTLHLGAIFACCGLCLWQIVCGGIEEEYCVPCASTLPSCMFVALALSGQMCWETDVEWVVIEKITAYTGGCVMSHFVSSVLKMLLWIVNTYIRHMINGHFDLNRRLCDEIASLLALVKRRSVDVFSLNSNQRQCSCFDALQYFLVLFYINLCWAFSRICMRMYHKAMVEIIYTFLG